MEIIVGKTAGFCYGVKRAVEGAQAELINSEKTICCLGELVHNEQVIHSLEEKGMEVIENIEQANNKVIIRAHGVTKDLQDKAKELKIEILDYTCPNVLKIHEIAEEYANNGFHIFLLGNKKHPENLGTMSYCGKYFDVIEQENEVISALENFRKNNSKKLLVISQTTYSLEKFYIIKEIIQNELPKDIELVIKNTICKATELRQKETEKIAKEVEVMVIIGGKNSSNTRKLYDIAKQNCENTICIETKEELQTEQLKRYKTIGIMAGASTPKESIDNVIDMIKEWNCITI